MTTHVDQDWRLVLCHVTSCHANHTVPTQMCTKYPLQQFTPTCSALSTATSSSVTIFTVRLSRSMKEKVSCIFSKYSTRDICMLNFKFTNLSRTWFLVFVRNLNYTASPATETLDVAAFPTAYSSVFPFNWRSLLPVNAKPPFGRCLVQLSQIQVRDWIL